MGGQLGLTHRKRAGICPQNRCCWTGGSTTTYEPVDAHQQREIASSVITRLSKFASSRVARRILGQRRSTGDLREVVRHGKLMLAELCK